MRKNVVVVALALCAALSSCAPPAVPFGASVHWSLKGSFSWRWTRRFEQGCVAWTAKESWAAVQLLVDSQCEGRRDIALRGRGIRYFSSSDEIVFQDYWPQFETIGGLLCPEQISAAQIAEVRRLTSEALAASKTDGERRVLARIDERLSVVDGGNLMTHHGGLCSDLPQEAWDAPRNRHDAWQDGR